MFPSEIMDETPNRRTKVTVSSAMIRAPDCEIRVVWPLYGRTGAKLAFALAGLLMVPTMFGPITRPPEALTIRFNSSSSFLFPTSAKPLVMTMWPLTPALAHCRATSSTLSAGTQYTAASTGPGTSAMEGYVLRPRISVAPGLIG